MKPAELYVTELATYYADEQSSEHSYRTPLQNYLATIFPSAEGYEIQHDPRAEKGNKPDYFIRKKGGVPLLYIEVKSPGTDLDKIERSEQATRYFGYTNLIISDYAEFRFYRNGEPYDEPITLARLDKRTRSLAPTPEAEERLARTMQDFVTSHKEPILHGKHLAKIMGGRAQRIRDNVLALLGSEREARTDLEAMMRFIKEHLITNFEPSDFADMYAQTIVYGLFAARHHDSTADTFTRHEAQSLVPKSNPFLRQFFGHIAGPSFPKQLEIIVDELCEVFAHANVKVLMEEYFKQGTLDGGTVESPDPVIHFYEDFLREYNPQKKMEMGVFYTPVPVVRFIVRGVDELLKKEFGIERGLSDNQKIPIEKTGLGKNQKEVTDKVEVHRVQVLDVATGTGTFLNETIKYIYDASTNIHGRWTSYVEDHVLPRLHGFELMMASYTIAHLKLGMTLAKEGVLEFKHRLGVYLTNTLDDAHDLPFTSSLFGVVESIAAESKKASEVKRETPIMVVMGNPPYSGISQNKHYTANDAYKVEPGGTQKLQERKHWLDDDYVKFIRFGEEMIEKNGEGIVAMITAHGYLDNPTFRGMRWHLRKTFDAIYVLDLHGNSNKKEVSPDGSADHNVFDIKTGVAIIFGVKKKRESAAGEKPLATVYHAELWGNRKGKFGVLNTEGIQDLGWSTLAPSADAWRIEGEGRSEYSRGFSVAELFPKNTTGIVTARDSVVIDTDRTTLLKRIQTFAESDMSENELRRYLFPDKKDGKYKAGDTRGWKLMEARKKIHHLDHNTQIQPIAYRPFDTRYCYYHPDMVDWGRFEVMKNLVKGKNFSLVVMRQASDDSGYNHTIATNLICDNRYMFSGKGITIQAPLYLYDNNEKISNLNHEIVNAIEGVVGTTTPEDIFDYVYATLHSPSYRTMYGEFLKQDFPRVPYPQSKEVFWELVGHGGSVAFPIAGSNEVGKPIFKNSRIYLNDSQYWEGECVTKDVFEFYIGGYQPAQKYLKDRKGRILTTAEFENYEAMLRALSETIKVMRDIDTIKFF